MAVNNKPTRITGSDHVWCSYTVTVPETTAIEAPLRPDYWDNVAAKFRQFDEVRVIAEDGSYILHLLVTVAGGKFVNVAELWRWVREGGAEKHEQAASDGLDIAVLKWRGPVLKNCVMRVSDGECLKEGFASKAEAERWRLDYVKMVNGG